MFWKQTEKGIRVNLKVIANSKKNEIVAENGDFLRIKIKARAEKGKANKVLNEYLAKFFGVAKKDIVIIKGEHSHFKTVFIGIDKNNFLRNLNCIFSTTILKLPNSKSPSSGNMRN